MTRYVTPVNVHGYSLGRLVELDEIKPLLADLGDDPYSYDFETRDNQTYVTFDVKWARDAFAKAWAGRIATPDSGSPATDSNEAKPKGKAGIVVQCLLAMGVLHTYNIIAHHQEAIDLSQSMQMLAAWWRHYINIPFDWLHWDLTSIQREVLVLVLFFGTAANFAHLREHGKNILSTIDPLSGDHTLAKPGYIGVNKYDAWGFVASLVVIYGSLIFVFSDHPYIIGLIVIGYVFGWFFLAIGLRLHIALVPLAVVVMAVWTVGMAIQLWVTAVAKYYRNVLRSLRFLIVLLIADLAARFALDPLLARIPSLTFPPPR